MRSAAAVLAATLFCSGCGTGLRHTMEAHPAALNNWGAVMKLQARAYVTVHEFSGTVTRGLLVSAGQDQLTVNDWKADRTIPRSDIRRIFLKHTHTGSRAVTGLGLGALAGGLVGALAVPGHPVLGAVVVGTVCGLAGGFKGAIRDVITSTSDDVLVFYTDPPQPGAPLNGAARASDAVNRAC